MPLLHKIIRRGSGAGELKGLYDLVLKKDFSFVNNRSINSHDDRLSGSCETPSEILTQANLEANSIVEQAGVRATAMLEEARRQATTEAENIKTTAAKEGYEQGYQSALKTAQGEAESIRNTARKVLVRAEDVREQKLKQLKEEILKLSIEIAEKIVTRELETNSNVIISIAEEAIQLAGSQEHVVLWVNPFELEICENKRDRLMGLLPPRAELQIITDQAIEPGGCVIENKYGKVDAQLSTRWQNLLASLKQGAE